MYKFEILNDFYRELFSTTFCDTCSVTQDVKTDIIFEQNLDKSDESFKKWFDGLIDCYTTDHDVNKTELLKAISESPEFRQDVKDEFDQIMEEYDSYDDDYYSDDEE